MCIWNNINLSFKSQQGYFSLAFSSELRYVGDNGENWVNNRGNWVVKNRIALTNRGYH